jgi:hypothetical protein
LCRGASGVAQVIEGLLSKHSKWDAPSSSPIINKKKRKKMFA